MNRTTNAVDDVRVNHVRVDDMRVDDMKVDDMRITYTASSISTVWSLLGSHSF